LLDRQHLRRRVEVGGVGEQEAQRVADAAIGLDDALEDLVGDRQLAGVVGGRHPQAQDLGAERVGNFCGAITLPFDLDIFMALPSTTKPCVSSAL
jgi:hypothetical protein